VVTTEGDEVELVGLLEAFEARWLGGAGGLHPTLRKGAKDGAPGLFGWSALPEEALDEINRIQTRLRLNEVVKTGSPVSFHELDHETETAPGAAHARRTDT
jgi:hypothetical protein